MAEDKQWEIKVSVPMRLPVEQRQELFAAVVGAVEEWEPAPADRDGWDADVAGCPADEWPEIVRLASSRQAWAEEAAHLKQAAFDSATRIAHLLDGLAYGPGANQWQISRHHAYSEALAVLDDCFSAVMVDYLNVDTKRVCACVSDTQATALVNAGWSLPQCTVHPESGA